MIILEGIYKKVWEEIMFKSKCVRSGQARAYQDSVYGYEIESDQTPEEVKLICLTEIHKCNQKYIVNINDHTGACGFPFGLDSFYSFEDHKNGTYTYIVTEPYCD